MIKQLKSRHASGIDCVDFMFDKITVEEQFDRKVFCLYVNIIVLTSALKKVESVYQFQQLFEKMQKFSKGSLPNMYQKLLFKFAVKKTYSFAESHGRIQCCRRIQHLEKIWQDTAQFVDRGGLWDF